MKYFTITFILAFILGCSSVSIAQYNEYFRFTDVRGTMVYVFSLQKVIEADGQLLKNNGVKEVTVSDETGAIQSRMSINKEGRITNYSSYEYNNGEEINYALTWLDEYSIAKINYSEHGRNAMSIEYVFKYKDYLPVMLSADFGLGLAEDYIFDFTKADTDYLLNKISFNDKYKDTIYMEQIFNYDNEGRLVNVKDTKFESTLDSVYYDGNFIGINTKHFKKRKFEIQGDRIVSETTVHPVIQVNANANNQKKEIPDIVSTVNYFYKENGLIDYITTGRGEISLKSYYTYEYYDK